MKYKLLVCDLDGTLLRDDKTISAYTRGVLARCREKGALFLPSTARPPRAVSIFHLEADGALCHNGGVALLGGETVWEQGMDPELTVRLAGRLLGLFPGVRLSAESGGELFANFDPTVFWPQCPYVPCGFTSLPSRPVEKLLVGLEDSGQADALRKLLPEGLAMQVADGNLAMIQPRGIDKGRALWAVCEKLGISPAQAAAFGDDLNDIPMLQTAGAGIAVANALPEVKAAASGVCLSNQEDGPARWLEEHLLADA